MCKGGGGAWKPTGLQIWCSNQHPAAPPSAPQAAHGELGELRAENEALKASLAELEQQLAAAQKAASSTAGQQQGAAGGPAAADGGGGAAGVAVKEAEIAVLRHKVIWLECVCVCVCVCACV